nr:Chain D, Synthetic Peptide [synthetic construct]3KZE_E Chain E, Synthetic Peptide [synthetic construct]
SSRKEYYA